jgi:hypothetical protein
MQEAYHVIAHTGMSPLSSSHLHFVFSFEVLLGKNFRLVGTLTLHKYYRIPRVLKNLLLVLTSHTTMFKLAKARLEHHQHDAMGQTADFI